MGDFGIDTTVTGGPTSDGRGAYSAVLNDDWQIWGPSGGYVLSVLLRAAGAHTDLHRPASITVHFLGSASFDEVTIATETLRRGRRSESIRVSMTQGERPIAEALVWAVAEDVSGPEHAFLAMPSVPDPQSLPTFEELMADRDNAPYPFWTNVEVRPIDWVSPEEWEQRSGLEPVASSWWKFRPTPTFDDPFVDCGRVAVPLDTDGWPAGARALDAGIERAWMAPNMDVHVNFHDLPDGSDHLLSVVEAPTSRRGLMGAQGWAWSTDGRLLATAIQQMLFREVAPPAPSGE